MDEPRRLTMDEIQIRRHEFFARIERDFNRSIDKIQDDLSRTANHCDAWDKNKNGYRNIELAKAARLLSNGLRYVTEKTDVLTDEAKSLVFELVTCLTAAKDVIIQNEVADWENSLVDAVMDNEQGKRKIEELQQQINASQNGKNEKTDELIQQLIATNIGMKSVIEDKNKYRFEKWATVPDCINEVFELAKDEKEMEPPQTKNTLRITIQKELNKKSGQRKEVTTAGNFYPVADIAEVMEKHYRKFTTETYIREFSSFACEIDKLHRKPRAPKKDKLASRNKKPQ